MHEVHHVQKLVAEAKAQAQAKGLKKVREVVIQVGELLGFDEGSIRIYWEDMTSGTPLDGAKLVVQFIPAKLECPKCGQVFAKKGSDLNCPQCKCLGKPAPGGKEFNIKEIVGA